MYAHRIAAHYTVVTLEVASMSPRVPASRFSRRLAHDLHPVVMDVPDCSAALCHPGNAESVAPNLAGRVSFGAGRGK